MLGKQKLVAAALVAAFSAGSSWAAPGDIYQSTFQGVTFTFTQTDADTLTFDLKGTLAGDWAPANFLASFDLKDLGLNFGTQTGTANGPGATNLLGLNAQLSASSVDCVSAGSPPGSICFDITDQSVNPQPFDFLYTINFSAPLDIASTGPHLQLAFTATADSADKIGSLYSQSVPLCTDCGGGGGTFIPEPGSLALLGVALLGAGAVVRRRS